ncbi:hypothetical protein Y032_0037g3511 [Ancylostoma ceylanicum]|uniref:Uncharacterized protein n=1 Tax=Ancylostoma ceylanicum TaxID=53326 RepID=A0A016ULM4_9BILA|nr:hypothetical protein Y032_0037g3511 [Ancylostoma ceylanicum]
MPTLPAVNENGYSQQLATVNHCQLARSKAIDSAVAVETLVRESRPKVRPFFGLGTNSDSRVGEIILVLLRDWLENIARMRLPRGDPPSAKGV